MGTIRIGTSGYSFQDWKGTAYPSTIKDSQMFSYYVEQFRFNTVEINYTYYRLPSAKSMVTLAKKSPEDFDFTIKLFGGITHEPWKNPPPARVDTQLCQQFTEGIKPLAESGKLGGVLAQFPVYFLPSEPHPCFGNGVNGIVRIPSLGTIQKIGQLLPTLLLEVEIE